MTGARPIGFVYMLHCADGSYYIGSHRGDDPGKRVWAHNQGIDKHAYTFTRRPVELVYVEPFDRFDEMVAYERRIKGWSRAKKEALIRGDGGALKDLSKRGVKPSLASHPSRRDLAAAPQDEEVSGFSAHSPHPEEPRSGVSKDGGGEYAHPLRRGLAVAPQDEGVSGFSAHKLHPEEPRSGVSKDGGGEYAHPSRRGLAVAPQDEEVFAFSAHKLHPEEPRSGVSKDGGEESRRLVERGEGARRER